MGIAISPNVLSLSTLDNNTTTFSLSLPDTVVVSLFLYRSTTSFVSIPNNHSLLRISTWCRNCVNCFSTTTVKDVSANGNPILMMNATERQKFDRQLRDCQALENNESLPLESKYNESLRKRKLDSADFFHE